MFKTIKCIGVFLLLISMCADSKSTPSPSTIGAMESYPVHRNIMATLFWVGEESKEDNGDTSNLGSVWDDNWMAHFGGVDTPKHRNGYMPSGFTPRENPFYVALPYNDFRKGNRKADAMAMIPWAQKRKWRDLESMCKNQWVKIVKDNKTVYAQWEDAGPFQYNDSKYVFGTAPPRNNINKKAGIDVSPAIGDYLNLTGMDKVEWQFVDEKDVADGPWKQIVTTSQIDWE